MRSKKDFTFSDGGAVKVHEVSSADLDTFQDLASEAEKETYNDAALGVFAKSYYPIFAACTDNPPPLEDVYKKEPCDLDNWYLLACQLNSDWLGDIKYSEETIKINGKSITVKSRRPSVELRLAQLQAKLSKDAPLENVKDEEYRLGGYIGVAAASFGKIPSAYEAKHELGLKDFSLWHATVRKLIPEWYETSETVKAVEVESKKKAESAPGS